MLPSWLLSLRADNKSPNTLRSYETGVVAFLDWADETGVPAILDRSTVAAFVADLLDSGASASTAVNRHQSLRRFSAWLVDEGEIAEDRLLKSKPPKVDVKVVEPLDDDQLHRLVKACAGTTFRDRRDEAIVRLMATTAMRAGEVVALTVDDIDLDVGQAVIRRGKGGKGRSVPFGPKVARALDRYLRARRSHRLADSPDLFLGSAGRTLGYGGLNRTLGYRARLAGIDHFHPHLLRHTAASKWLARGGSEHGLMSVAGWSRPDMLSRYTAHGASERAAVEARRLNMDDL
jgi:integrase/recombinase XerD